jgi:hypothetical protein
MNLDPATEQTAISINDTLGWVLKLVREDPVNCFLGLTSAVVALFLLISCGHMIDESVDGIFVFLAFFSVTLIVLGPSVVLPCSYFKNWVGLICAGFLINCLGACVNAAMLAFLWDDTDKLGSAAASFTVGAAGGLMIQCISIPALCLRYAKIRHEEGQVVSPVQLNGTSCAGLLIIAFLFGFPLILEVVFLSYAVNLFFNSTQ